MSKHPTNKVVTKYVNAIRYMFIFVLFVALLFWFGGGLARPGLIGLFNDIIFGVFIFIMLVINCIAGILSMKGKDHERLTNRMTLFTMLIFVTLPFMIVVLELALENKLF